MAEIAIEDGRKYVWGSVGTDKEKGILKGTRIDHPRPIPFHTAVPSKLKFTYESGFQSGVKLAFYSEWWVCGLRFLTPAQNIEFNR
jgi:hypothetical protein